MKKLIILLLLPLILPFFMYGHIKDERLFKTGNIPPSVMILIDRSGSMDDEVYYYDTTNALQTIVLHDYSGYHDTTIIGWYDNEIFSDGPGDMSWFNNTNADTTWTLKIHQYSWFNLDSLIVNSWKLRLFHGGTFTDFNGNSFALGTFQNNASDAINVTGIGTIDSARCYIDLSCKDSWFGHTYLNEIEVDLEGPSNTDTTVQHTSTRIKEALKVLHSLLDANADGIVDSTDEKYLNVKMGQGFHIYSNAYQPPGAYAQFSYSGVQSYNENTRKWEDLPYGYNYYLHTDTIGSHFKKIWDDINYTKVRGWTPNGKLLKVTIDYYDKWMGSHPDLYCIPKNIILITDGESNTPTTCSNGSKDVVYYAYKAHQDSINVFAVGFGTDITQGGANELNWVAYWGGTDNPSDTNIGDTTKVDPRYGCPVRTPSDYYLS
ncbi:MAG TPA: VWA domain-containing protein, partial [Firmicutes bacterium]|nr:VWA domain-containing protein [Bacillota bacterium]